MKLPFERLIMRIFYAMVGLVLLIIAAAKFGPSGTVDIRIDCGDLRYKYLGVPYSYEKMTEPHRTTLLALSHDAGISPDLVPVSPQTTFSNVPSGNYQVRYDGVANWVGTDPMIARLLLKDVSADIKDANGVR